jgi:TetR/AcrR family transcriptional regulator, transcriptional repressor of bet genes
MPARGDHDQRRREVARIAADLVATRGLAAATHRAIAEAAGCSTTVVSHYFSDKRDLVEATYKEVGDRVTARLQAAAEDSTEPLVSTLEALLPLDKDRRRDWRLLFTFLGLAATDAQLTQEQRVRATTARGRIEHALVAEQHAGQVRTDIDVPTVGRFLLAIVLGIGMQAFFDPAGWSRDRMRAALKEPLDDLRPARRHPRHR